ncbi:ribonuclease III [candidate division KSB1 bacterium]
MNPVIKNWFYFFFPKIYHSRPRGDHIDWNELEKRLNYKIKNKEIFKESLRHRSHPSCSGTSPSLSNERLEFLGDALVNFFVGEFLYINFPDSAEGDLTKMRSTFVSREFLAKISQEMVLGEFLFLGEGEEKSGGRKKDSILSNAMESVIGAVYMDSGIESARKFVETMVMKNYEKVIKSEGFNYKGDLLEYIQRRHLPMPKFITKRETGPDHKKIYTVAVQVGKKIMGTGKGKSKKIAEQEAAKIALEKINSN